MKRFMLYAAILLTASSMCATTPAKTASKTTVAKKVEVYYFHFTRRCETCKAVEAESKKAIEALYPAQVKSGQVSFTSINLDDKSSKATAAKCKAEGQSLLIISGNKRIDITDKGFMYALSNPDKLKAAIKTEVENRLK